MESIMFPSFRAWVMALKLAIPAYGGAAVVFGFEFWRFFIVGMILAVTTGDALALGISAAALVGGLLWFLLLAGIYSFILKLFWQSPPKLIAPPGLGTLVKRDFLIIILALVPIILIFSGHIFLITSLRQMAVDVRSLRQNYQVFLIGFSWLWLIASAYLYHLWDRRFKQISK